MTINPTVSRLVSALADSRLRPHSRLAVTAGAAAAIFVGGLLALDTPEVMAQGGLFGALFGDEQPRHHYIVEPLRYYAGSFSGWRWRRHAAHPPGLRFRREMLAERHGRDRAAARLAPVAPHRTAHVIITKPPAPAPKVASFHAARRAPAVLPAADEAVRASNRRVAAVQPTESEAVFNDPTLRKGDTVVTSKGVMVFKGGEDFPHKNSDFMSLAETRGLTPEKRGALAAIERALKTPRGRAMLSERAQEKQNRRGLRSQNDDGGRI
ncbi:hypothetical protein [Methylocystis heyeri]|uniref:Uncharacterized protein n=1 Tax=Methylocystis heyeri TaxID=391905 RepID=A0A6B8KAV7_9HYPH|nr:hypothetical protein [Methylocystis heyeri]QGM44807.1 hypothetical protein H2LOC_003385 [Methylocystis heyeri]